MANALISWQEIVETIQAMPEIDSINDNAAGQLAIEDDVFATSLDDFFNMVAIIQESEAPHLNRLRVAMFSSDTQEPDAYLQKTIDGKSPLNRLCFLLDAELRLYELEREDKTQTVSEEELLRALTYGMMSIEPGMDAVLLIENGHNHDFSAQQILTLLHNEMTDEDTVFKTICKVGDLSIAAMMGAMIAARMARIPVFTDSKAGLAAAGCLCHYREDAARHCIWLGTALSFSNGLFQLPGLCVDTPVIDAAMPGYIGMMKLLQLKAICQCMQPRSGVHVHMAVGGKSA